MPLFIFAYFLIEALAFFGVAKLIGVGWALLAIFALMFLGGALASLALRGTLVNAAEGRSSLGRVAGDSALLMTGWLLCIIPGFVSSLLGFLLIFGPTRGFLRRFIRARTIRSMENFGVRVYNTSPLSQFQTSYGNFGTGRQAGSHQAHEQDTEHDVIDADELEAMFRAEGPEGDRFDGDGGASTSKGPDGGKDK